MSVPPTTRDNGRAFVMALFVFVLVLVLLLTLIGVRQIGEIQAGNTARSQQELAIEKQLQTLAKTQTSVANRQAAQSAAAAAQAVALERNAEKAVDSVLGSYHATALGNRALICTIAAALNDRSAVVLKDCA